VQLTERINRIQISPTAAVIAEADRLKSQGVDIADFGPGEPDFPTPEHIKKAAIRAIEENKSKYTPTGGIMPLREAICAWHKRELGSNYVPKECAVSVGGKPVHLTPHQFELLRVLAVNKGKLLTHRALLREVWGPGYGTESNLLHVNVSQLRRKIEPDRAHPQYLITEAGAGYRLVEPTP